MNHEWYYYVGGNCGYKEKHQSGVVVAKIEHVVQGLYEALLVRREDDWPRSIKGFFSLGTYDNPESAQAVIESILDKEMT